MPIAKEFTVRMEDRPGTLGKFCRALTDRGINIIAFQSFPSEERSSVRLIVDNPTNLKNVLDAQRVTYTETEVAQVRLPNRPGELGRAATNLGDANINIDYAYSGVDPATGSPVMLFGVADVRKAVDILDKASVAAA
jgi:hypothetical protein